MTGTPSSAALAFFKAHGCATSSSSAEVAAAAATYLAQARQVRSEVLEGAAKLLGQADSVSTLCAAAVYSCAGFGPLADDSAFASSEGISILSSELGLSDAMALPLREVRQRVAALRDGSSPEPSDTFLAHQARAIADAVIEWSAEHLEQAACV